LRVASERLPHVETVSLAINVDVGARFETPEQHGISHLLEHMAFKGTSTRSAQQIAEAFDDIGGQLNAFTSHEHTVYYAKILKDDLAFAAEVLCDILQDSTFDADELAKEQQVILQELAMHHDTPDDLVFDQFQSVAFPSQALGRSILGTAEYITRHSSADLKSFIAQYYHPSRMVVSAAGAVDHDALVRLMEKLLHLSGQSDIYTPQAGHYQGGADVVRKKLEQLQLVIGVEGIAQRDSRYYQSQILSTILGGGMSSRLFQEIREKRGLVYSIQSFIASYSDCGLFAIYAATGEKESAELLPVVCDELSNIRHSITAAELQRAKQQHKATLLMARESTSTLAEWIGRHLLHYGEYRDAAQINRAVDAITIDQLHQLADDLFAAPRLSFAALGPVSQVMGIDAMTAKLAA
jgi:predicted Zn-dependent peptidase